MSGHVRTSTAFIHGRDGNIAIMTALLSVPMFLFAGAAVDYTRYNTVRTDLIESLDAAGLAIAQLDALNGPEIRDLADASREAYLKQYGEDFFNENFQYAHLVDSLAVDFDITNTKITPIATGSLNTLILHVGQALQSGHSGAMQLSMSASTEITRAANGDTETALVLDTTGSMNQGTKMADLRAAATEFVDVLIRDSQTDYTSKVAIIPYGGSVNLADKADEARGGLVDGKAITFVKKGTKKSPDAVVTSNGHGFSNGDYIVITDVEGMTEINNDPSKDDYYRVASATANTFKLDDRNGNRVSSKNYSTYLSGGVAWCAEGDGCKYKVFDSEDTGVRRVFEVTNCVSERSGDDAYTDTAPALARLSEVYGPVDGAYMCPPSVATGLTDSRDDAKDTIEDLEAYGNTGGHIGVAWGWYALSPSFDQVFSGDAVPASYEDDVAKSVVIMTDGEYNSSYCEGVVSRSSTNGSGGSSDHIDCDAPNGHAFDQALELCDEMKAKGVTVYTVGFQIVDDQRARDLMSQCASGSSYAYLAEDGAALKRVFADIAQNIAQLHVSR